MKAPILYWISVAYLVLFVLGTDYAVIAAWPVGFPYNFVLSLIAGLYTIATIALICRSRLTVPAFLAAFVIFICAEFYAIWDTGAGPGVRDPEWLVLRAIPFLILIAIVIYCYRLTQRGFLR
jgi:hypothetical protein